MQLHTYFFQALMISEPENTEESIVMYAFLEGDIVHKSPSLLYLNVNGVGYEVHISLHTFSKIQHAERTRLFTHLQIREDAWVLYGFAEESERSTFRQLLSISGVGAATARIILSSLTTSELAQAVASGDAKTLERVKGIGAKTAQRIVLELKGKLAPATESQSFAGLHNSLEQDALNALVNLGISKAVAEGAIKKVKQSDELPVEELIKQALKVL